MKHVMPSQNTLFGLARAEILLVCAARQVACHAMFKVSFAKKRYAPSKFIFAAANVSLLCLSNLCFCKGRACCSRKFSIWVCVSMALTAVTKVSNQEHSEG